MALAAFGIAFGLSLGLVRLVRAWSLRTGRVAKPRKDRWHSKPTAMMGGVGFFLAFALTLVSYALLTGSWAQIPWGVLAGSLVVFLVGFYDDLYRITPPAKLVGQIVAAALVISLGYTTAFFTPRIPNNIIAQLPNIIVTFIWLIGITNAINLLDNMDGLAGGIALITALILSYFFWDLGSQGLLVVSLALVGAVLGFLVYNFPPASIFMGDSGSLFLGFTLAVLAIARQPQASNVFAVLGVPTLLFLLPILDTSLVTFTRILRGQSPVQGGRDHTSHRLIAFGLSERQAVLTLYAVALVSGLLAATLESIQYWYSLVLVPIVVLSLALLTAYLGGLKVVEPEAASPRRGFARIMLELTFRRRILEIVLDFFLIGIAYYLAFFVRYGFVMNDERLASYLQSLPLAFLGAYLAFYLVGVYRGVWRYVGLDDLLRYAIAAGVGSALLGLGARVIYGAEAYSEAVFFFYAIFLFLALAASRSSFRLLDQFAGFQLDEAGGEQRVVICGAGDAGEMALRWILMNPGLHYRAVGFVDPDPLKSGRQIHGVVVMGGIEPLQKLLEKNELDGLILATGGYTADGFADQVVALCRSRGCWVRSLRLEFELVE